MQNDLESITDQPWDAICEKFEGQDVLSEAEYEWMVRELSGGFDFDHGSIGFDVKAPLIQTSPENMQARNAAALGEIKQKMSGAHRSWLVDRSSWLLAHKFSLPLCACVCVRFVAAFNKKVAKECAKTAISVATTLNFQRRGITLVVNLPLPTTDKTFGTFVDVRCCDGCVFELTWPPHCPIPSAEAAIPLPKMCNNGIGRFAVV